MEGLDPSTTPYQLQQYDNNNERGESGGDDNNVLSSKQQYTSKRKNDNVEGFCLKRVYGTEHPNYHHFPDWFTSNIMTLQPPYHRMIQNKPEMLSTMNDNIWNNFRDQLTKAIHGRRRDGFLIAIGAIASFLLLYWPASRNNRFEEVDNYCNNCSISWWETIPPLDRLLEENKFLHTFIHVFIAIVVGSVWIYLWLIVSDRVKQTIQEFNVHCLEINDVKVELERYYRVTESSSGSGLDESIYILFIKQQQQQQLQNLSDDCTTFGREPLEIESSRNANWYEMEQNSAL